MEEHQVILNFCIALEELTKDLMKIKSLDKAQEIIANMQYISGHLLRTERHHIREEHTFIRRLVSFAEFDPSLEIRRQHDELGVQKRLLERTIYGVYTTPFEDFKKDIKLASNKLIRTLKNHVDIEDNVLYPQAVKSITDDERWNKMKEEADNIGYCCFTPNKS
jgi:hemerythrin-like domain-containing protein